MSYISYYELLGIATDATAEEIKRAYRSKAQQVHPDREGGSEEAFKQLNKAYECLSDPERRSVYDKTGTDEDGMSLQAMVNSVLLTIFERTLDIPTPKQQLAFIAETLTNQRDVFTADQVKLKSEIDRLTKRRSKVRVTSGDNIMHKLIDSKIDSKIEAIERQLRHQALALLINAAASDALKVYQAEDDPPPQSVNRSFLISEHTWPNGLF